MRCLLSQVDLLMQQRDEIDGLITQLVDELNQYIIRIPGIGLVTALLSWLRSATSIASMARRS